MGESNGKKEKKTFLRSRVTNKIGRLIDTENRLRGVGREGLGVLGGKGAGNEQRKNRHRHSPQHGGHRRGRGEAEEGGGGADGDGDKLDLGC